MSERAARIMLGRLDDPDCNVGDVLHSLSTLPVGRLSDGEVIIVDLARQFFNGGGTKTLYSAMNRLDEENWSHLIEAMLVERRVTLEGVERIERALAR